MDNLWQDIRFSIRSMFKKPAFTAIALIALALGIGANTALFSVIYSVLLKPLPFVQPDNLVRVWNTVDSNGQFSVTYPDFNDWRERNQSFEYLAAYNTRDFTLTGAGEPLRLRGARMTAETLPLLGVAPQRGRYFSAEEDKPGNRVAIISHRVWQEGFSSATDIVNQPVTRICFHSHRATAFQYVSLEPVCSYRAAAHCCWSLWRDVVFRDPTDARNRSADGARRASPRCVAPDCRSRDAYGFAWHRTGIGGRGCLDARVDKPVVRRRRN